MRNLLCAGVILITLLACDNDSSIPICGDLEGTDVNWVQEQITDIETREDPWGYIVQAEYKGDLVYAVLGCNPAAQYALIYVRCNGEVIEGPYNLEEFRNQKVIWSPENSNCNFN